MQKTDANSLAVDCSEKKLLASLQSILVPRSQFSCIQKLEKFQHVSHKP